MRSTFPIPEGVPTRLVLVEPGAIAALPAVLRELGHAPPARCVLLCDGRTLAAAGEAVEAALRDAGYEAARCVLLDDRPGEVSGDESQLAEAVSASAMMDVVLGIGSGVVNDLGKLAAHRTGRTYVAVATAASMNGYGSPVAAMIEGGVKRTLPAAATAAIIADLDVLAAAPRRLTRAGFADMLPAATATADWMLAHLVRDVPFDPRVPDLLDPVVGECQRRAAETGQGEPDALRLLVQALIYGAFGMSLAGHSAPASGGEHLISHLWEMQAHAARMGHALHGFQVALGTRVVAALYQRLLRLTPDDIQPDRLVRRWRPWNETRESLREAHGPLWSLVEPEAEKQHLSRDTLYAELTRVRDRWTDLRDRLAPRIPTPRDLLALHRAAGVPTDPAEIGQTRGTVRHALLHARNVRARFTVLDLAHELGVLEPWADAVLDDADVY